MCIRHRRKVHIMCARHRKYIGAFDYFNERAGECGAVERAHLIATSELQFDGKMRAIYQHLIGAPYARLLIWFSKSTLTFGAKFFNYRACDNCYHTIRTSP